LRIRNGIERRKQVNSPKKTLPTPTRLVRAIRRIVNPATLCSNLSHEHQTRVPRIPEMAVNKPAPTARARLALAAPKAERPKRSYSGIDFGFELLPSWHTDPYGCPRKAELLCRSDPCLLGADRHCDRCPELSRRGGSCSREGRSCRLFADAFPDLRFRPRRAQPDRYHRRSRHAGRPEEQSQD